MAVSSSERFVSLPPQTLHSAPTLPLRSSVHISGHRTEPTSEQKPRKALTERQEQVLSFIRAYMREHGFPPTIVEICREFSFSSTNAATQFLLALEKKRYIKRTTKGASRGIQLLNERGEPVHPDTSYTQAPEKSLLEVQHGAYPVPHHMPSSSPHLFAKPPADTVKNIVIIGEGTSTNPLSVFLSPRGQIRLDVQLYLPNTTPELGATTNLFAAVVSDDAMSAEGIYAGDLVIARQQFTAAAGNLVVVLAQDTSLVRRLAAADTSVRNHPSVALPNTAESSASPPLLELRAATNGFPPIPFRGNDSSLALLGVIVGAIRVFSVIEEA
jgi:SOS-response transcriptional repressor LexA